MSFFDLNYTWKIWVYRMGLLFLCLSIGGWILIGVNANLNWGEDILKRKEKPKFNGKLEKFFYLIGYIFTASMSYAIISFIVSGLS